MMLSTVESSAGWRLKKRLLDELFGGYWELQGEATRGGKDTQKAESGRKLQMHFEFLSMLVVKGTGKGSNRIMESALKKL